MKDENNNKRKQGRETLYKEKYDAQVFKLCLLGATDKEIADFFEVDVSTVNNWKIAHPSFFESIKSGKLKADADVASSLFKRASGYEHPEDKVFQHNGEAVVVPTVKHVQPDVTAQIFWLKNRRHMGWRDKHEVDVSGSVTLEISEDDKDV